MQIVNLIGGNRRSPKKRESNMSKNSRLSRARRPILTLHQSVIGGRRAEGNSIPLIVRAHAGKRAATRHRSLEVIDVRGLKVRSPRLIVTAVLVQPWNRIRISPAIRRHAVLIIRRCSRSRNRQSNPCQRCTFQ